jgi:excinuclease ABC subunit A
MQEYISITGCRVHNLKNIDLNIPRNKLVVITGVSGSGKSSLAFDTIYSEAQRRYIETFSAYARQYIGGLKKPDVDKIDGLSPVIAIEQKTTTKNPRSTVGTTTEIYDFLRLLYSRVSDAYSPKTGKKMVNFSNDQILHLITSKYQNKKISIYSPIIKSRKGHYRELFFNLRKQGFTKVRVDNEIQDIKEGMELDRYKVHDIDLLIDKLTVNVEKTSLKRLEESVEIALSQGDDSILIIDDCNKLNYYSKNLVCPETGISFDKPEPNSFSFNSPKGMCKDCSGLGVKNIVDMNLLIPDYNKSIYNGGITALGTFQNTWIFKQLENIANKYDFDLKDPINKIPDEAMEIILNGGKEKFNVVSKSLGLTRTYEIDFEGIINFILNQYSNAFSKKIKTWSKKFMRTIECNKCCGSRLNENIKHFKIDHKDITEISKMDFDELYDWIKLLNTKISEKKLKICQEIITEIKKRVEFIRDVGLNYLSIGRETRSLSGGESQRIRLATQIGSRLQDVLYILDEPSIGLHQIDNLKLIKSLKKLRDLGNTVIVVEHDREIMLQSDHLIDLGPGAGEKGGEIVFNGKTNNIKKISSITSDYLFNKQEISRSGFFKTKSDGKLILSGCTGNNLKNVELSIPLGKIIGICGLSGSGKSSLINKTLYPILSRAFYSSTIENLPYSKISGINNIDKVIQINQSPIGRTPRSNPATYTGLYGLIREMFAKLPESQIRGYKAGRFSFNVKGGRCEECQGAGMKKIEMNFLPDIYVDCEVCNGKRFNKETLTVKLNNNSISDILNMTISDAEVVFKNYPKILSKLKVLIDVGLGYIRLGQQSTTLSGGEAQRIKLATELSKRDTGKTLYIFDEPTTGLHFADIDQLMKIIIKLSEKGNTIIIIEHNTDVLKIVDHFVELGPGGGKNGGKVIFQGDLKEMLKNADSPTSNIFKKELNLG